MMDFLLSDTAHFDESIILSLFLGNAPQAPLLKKKTYFQSPRISWKAQKDQVNIIFPSTFWLKNRPCSNHRKVQSNKFSVISKYHLSINFLTQKKIVFPISETSKPRTFQWLINIIFRSIFWLKILPPPRISHLRKI